MEKIPLGDIHESIQREFSRLPGPPMSKGFTITSHEGYVHVLYRPNYEITRETMIATCDELEQVCKQDSCVRVLLEAPSPRRKMDTTAAFESGTRLARVSPGLRIAMLFYNYKTDELTEFFKTVAHNRGVRVEYFSEKKKALEWLRVERDRNAKTQGNPG
jgi:hypothetical protein